MTSAGDTGKNRPIVQIGMADRTVVIPSTLMHPTVYREVRNIMFELRSSEGCGVMAVQTIGSEPLLSMDRFVVVILLVTGNTGSISIRVIIDIRPVMTIIAREGSMGSINGKSGF